jgi:hypothetical protein
VVAGWARSTEFGEWLLLPVLGGWGDVGRWVSVGVGYWKPVAAGWAD